MDSKKNIGLGIGASVCLVIGFIIYCLSREHILFMDWLGIQGAYINTHHPIVKWTIYCLPDGLWYMALLLLMDMLYQIFGDISNGRIMVFSFMSLSVILPFALELAQKWHIISGTYDIVDIITYLITLFLFVLCEKKVLFSSHSK